MSWEDAQAFVKWLSQETGESYRLPTEAEWEYGARGRTTTPFWTGATISTAQANYDGKLIYGRGKEGIHRGGTVAVDDPNFPANPFGLHHVHGNVFEWVLDGYYPSYRGAPADGHLAVQNPGSPIRVSRGGSFGCDPRVLRSASRGHAAPDDRHPDQGFRVARML
jgi:formylglycine-generating enzyme required for sulfatase activity